MKLNNMSSAIKYLVNGRGSKTSVIVPIRTWEKINKDNQKLQNKLNLFIGLKNACMEIKESKQTGRKLQTLKDFLSEGNR
jgi:polyhydroxyalkanoate synthesis regulator protein